MNLVDAIIIVILIIGFLDGYRLGVIRSVAGFFGSIIVFFLSWVLKTPLANALINIFPQLGGNSAVSVLIYHIISFVILLIIFSLLYKIVLKITNVLEKIMNATIILGFVSKMLGGVFGVIKTYIILFIVLFVLSIFNFSFMNSSRINKFVLDKTPLLAPMVKNTWDSVKGVYEASNIEEALVVLFENNIITEENMNKLLKKGE